ncbi:MAG: beta-glycosidase [Bacteroidales bacterium]|nr:beta-glycosidase [Bacteroidales bacterium]
MEKRHFPCFISKKYIFFLFAIFFVSVVTAQENHLTGDWYAKKANQTQQDGQTLTRHDINSHNWLNAVVPGTVLTTLLHNNEIPDPFYATNNDSIPDIYNTGVDYYTYWFYTTFEIPKSKEYSNVWLNLRGINYSTKIYLNGHKVNCDSIKGMFLRHRLNITDLAKRGEKNRLAILVHPPNPPGKANGGQGGDGIIAKNVTMQFTAGWDWIKPIRDRNTGIWDKISVTTSGPVTLEDPYIITDVPGKREPEEEQYPAYVNVAVQAQNHGEKALSGYCTYKVGAYSDTMSIQIPAGSKKRIEFETLEIQDPKLWWPNGMGKANLYPVEIQFFNEDSQTSDSKNLKIGIRDVTTKMDTSSGGRMFRVNGQKLFIRGGNWIASDALLRLSAERYEHEVRMHAEANLNTIRIWGGSITERPEFYEACDKHGILVWQDLWITGDCNGRWRDPKKKENRKQRRQYPDNHQLFLKSARDQIKMLRNHPSLCVWIGGNEFPPPPGINDSLKNKIFPDLDRKREYFELSTSENLSQNIYPGTVGDGPYGYQDPEMFFNKRHYPLNSEIGSVGMPVYETLEKILSPEHIKNFPGTKDEPDREWRYHCYIGYSTGRFDYIDIYGTPETAKAFCEQAQIANYLQYRSLIEGMNAQMWNWYTGVLIWKTQNPWSSLRGQLYDHSLAQNGAFYGVRKAAEPLHAQVNLGDRSVKVVNTTAHNKENLTLESSIYDRLGKQHKKTVRSISIPSMDTKRLFKVYPPSDTTKVFFVKLKLLENNREISENFYWLSDNRYNFRYLNQLKEVQVSLNEERLDDSTIKINLENESSTPALWNRLQLYNSKSNKRILPAFYSENYFSLLPGESKTVTIDVPADLKKEAADMSVELSGFNTENRKIQIME